MAWLSWPGGRTDLLPSRRLMRLELCQLSGPLSWRRNIVLRWKRAAAQARAQAGPEDMVLACGSLYMIGDAKRGFLSLEP